MMRARAVYYRERDSRMYGSSVYGLAHFIVELPWLFFIVLSITSILYFMVGFQRDAGAFFFYVFTVFILSCLMLSLGQMAAAALPTPEVAQGVLGCVAAASAPPFPLSCYVLIAHFAGLFQAVTYCTCFSPSSRHLTSPQRRHPPPLRVWRPVHPRPVHSDWLALGEYDQPY